MQVSLFKKNCIPADTFKTFHDNTLETILLKFWRLSFSLFVCYRTIWQVTANKLCKKNSCVRYFYLYYSLGLSEIEVYIDWHNNVRSGRLGLCGVLYWYGFLLDKNSLLQLREMFENILCMYLETDNDPPTRFCYKF